jgi:transposase
MGQAIAVRTDYTAGELRRLAKRVKEAAQARRLFAIAAVLDGASRTEAAKIGGMDRQTLRDWVIRFNDQGPDGLINIPSPCVPPKLDAIHRAFLARLVEEGPIPAVHGVVRWRACDLIMRLHEEFGISVSDDTIYRALKDLGFSHVSARPKAYKQDPEAMEAFKKISLHVWRKSARSSRSTSCYRPATVKPCSFISTRSPPRLHPAPTPFSSLTKPVGTAPRNSGYQPTSPSCRCRRAPLRSTAKRTYGSSCVRTGCQTASSNLLTTSSITAATPGTHLSANRGRSCPSPDATGPSSVTHCEDWYHSSAGSRGGVVGAGADRKARRSRYRKAGCRGEPCLRCRLRIALRKPR